MIDYIERVNLSVLAARPRQQQCHSSSAQGRLQHKKKGWRRPGTQKTDTKKHKQNNKKEHKDWIVWGRLYGTSKSSIIGGCSLVTANAVYTAHVRRGR